MLLVVFCLFVYLFGFCFVFQGQGLFLLFSYCIALTSGIILVSSRQPVSMHSVNSSQSAPRSLEKKLEEEYFLWSQQHHVHSFTSLSVGVVY